MKKAVKKICKIVGILLLIVVVAFGGLLGFLSVTEFKPEDVEQIEVAGGAEKAVRLNEPISVLSWNIGYGALGESADFFMDGGKKVMTADREQVQANIEGIASYIRSVSPDIVALQEVDKSSKRSHKIDQTAYMTEALQSGGAKDTAFAENFKTSYVPYPIPTIGKVDSGLLTISCFDMASAQRLQLPVPFTWPVSMVNLKRCLLVSRFPVENSDRELVLINLHLEAYDDGEGKIRQTQMFRSVIDEELEKGNYVVACGDFNQVFSDVDISAYPTYPDMWTCGRIDAADFADGGWQLRMDPAVPTCRSLDKAYAGADLSSFQFYMIDGYIFSPNITVTKVETIDRGFVYSDHNPVAAEIVLN